MAVLHGCRRKGRPVDPEPNTKAPPEDFQGMPVDDSWSAFLEKLDPHSKSKARADAIDSFKPGARQSTASGSKELAP